jgi:hypothetical protein
MLLCESVYTQYPFPGFGVHVALRVLSVHNTPSLCLVLMLLCESVYTLPLYRVWCSCCSLSLSVHNTPPLGLVFMLLCESVGTQYPFPVFGVDVAL